MGTESAVFFNGVRCWQYAKCIRVAPSGNTNSAKAGVSRRRGRINQRSPNFIYQITVPAYMPPIDGDHAGSKSALTGASRQVTRQIYIGKTLEFFIDNSGEDKGLGRLAWVQDDTEKLTVTGGPYSGDNQVISYTGSGFTPASGDIVVIRSPSTSAGFVGSVEAIGTGTITVDCKTYGAERDANGDPERVSVTVSSGWEIYKAQYYYDRVQFQQMQDQEVGNMVEDKTIMDVRYLFQSEAGIVYPAAMTPSF